MAREPDTGASFGEEVDWTGSSLLTESVSERDWKGNTKSEVEGDMGVLPSDCEGKILEGGLGFELEDSDVPIEF